MYMRPGWIVPVVTLLPGAKLETGLENVNSVNGTMCFRKALSICATLALK